MANGVTVVDAEVRKMFKDLKREIQTGSGVAKKHIKRFLIYKKAMQSLPFNESGIRNENGALSKWEPLSDAKNSTLYQKKLMFLKRGIRYTSPKGKRIQAPWDYAHGCMKKIPRSDYEDAEITRKAARPLVRTGLLMNSLVVKMNLKGNVSEFVQTIGPAAKKYGWIHFFGWSGNRSITKFYPRLNGGQEMTTAYNVTVPARPFLSWTKQDMDMLAKFLLAWVGEKSK